MKTRYTAETLAAFEAEVAERFNEGEIRAPVHLASGNEQHLINIFLNVHERDWVCAAWRSHYHCLLKGVPEAEVMRAIMEGRSITLTFPEHRVITSAIVGGIVPIALGLAWGLKRQGSKARVWCFMGDMTAATGIVDECRRYARGFDLPIRWVIENNGKSVGTPTSEVWGGEVNIQDPDSYWYTLGYPHSGAGRRVEF